MRDVLVRPVGQLARGHAEDQALAALDELHVANDEAVVESDGDESLQLIVLAQMHRISVICIACRPDAAGQPRTQVRNARQG